MEWETTEAVLREAIEELSVLGAGTQGQSKTQFREPVKGGSSPQSKVRQPDSNMNTDRASPNTRDTNRGGLQSKCAVAPFKNSLLFGSPSSAHGPEEGRERSDLTLTPDVLNPKITHQIVSRPTGSILQNPGHLQYLSPTSGTFIVSCGVQLVEVAPMTCLKNSLDLTQKAKSLTAMSYSNKPHDTVYTELSQHTPSNYPTHDTLTQAYQQLPHERSVTTRERNFCNGNFKSQDMNTSLGVDVTLLGPDTSLLAGPVFQQAKRPSEFLNVRTPDPLPDPQNPTVFNIATNDPQNMLVVKQKNSTNNIDLHANEQVHKSNHHTNEQEMIEDDSSTSLGSCDHEAINIDYPANLSRFSGGLSREAATATKAQTTDIFDPTCITSRDTITETEFSNKRTNKFAPPDSFPGPTRDESKQYQSVQGDLPQNLQFLSYAKSLQCILSHASTQKFSAGDIFNKSVSVSSPPTPERSAQRRHDRMAALTSTALIHKVRDSLTQAVTASRQGRTKYNNGKRFRRQTFYKNVVTMISTGTAYQDHSCTLTAHSCHSCTATAHPDHSCTATAHPDHSCTATAHPDHSCTATAHPDHSCTVRTPTLTVPPPSDTMSLTALKQETSQREAACPQESLSTPRCQNSSDHPLEMVPSLSLYKGSSSSLSSLSSMTISTTTPAKPLPSATTKTETNSGDTGRRLRARNQRRFLPEKVRQKRQTLQEMTRPLKRWLVRNRENPYPSKQDKVELVASSKMSLIQVSNWFANARRRLKNTVQGDHVSWAERIRDYNHFAEGNAELFSIPSSSEDNWDSDTEDIGETASDANEPFNPGPSLHFSPVSPMPTLSSPTTTQILAMASKNTCWNSPLLDDQQGCHPKFKNSIIQRYLHDASQPHDDGIMTSQARLRHLSSSTGSHDFEYLSTSSVSSPSHEAPQDSFNDFSEESETITIKKRITENQTGCLTDDMYWKEIGAALALTSLGKTNVGQ